MKLAILLTLAILSSVQVVKAQDATSIYDFKVTTIDGEQKSLADYKGKVLLIVNTASQCGFTGQYKGLQAVYEQNKDKGFEVLAFPANNFLGQEPGSNEDIKKFCALRFKTTFPLFAKISVKGDDIAPLYNYLTTASGFNGDITWNFNKFIVGKDGRVIARFDSRTEPEDSELNNKIASALAQ